MQQKLITESTQLNELIYVKHFKKFQAHRNISYYNSAVSTFLSTYYLDHWYSQSWKVHVLTFLGLSTVYHPQISLPLPSLGKLLILLV